MPQVTLRNCNQEARWQLCNCATAGMNSVLSESKYTSWTEDQEAGLFEGQLEMRGQSGFRLWESI